MDEETQKEAIALLENVQEVLSNHWFTHADGEDYNNNDVIDADRAIQAFLKRVKHGT